VKALTLRYSGSLLLAVGMLLLCGAGALASMSVAPLSLQFELLPEETGSGRFIVRNTGDETIDVSVSLHDWWRTDDGSLQILPAGTQTRSCAGWAVYSTSSVRLAAGEQAEVAVQLIVPADVLPGDHWAMLLVEEHPVPGEEAQVQEGLTDTTRVVVAYAAKILVRGQVDTLSEAAITGVEIAGTNPLQIAVTYENTGNKHLMTAGLVEIRDVLGETLRAVEIPPFPTLPGEARSLTIEDSSEEAIPDGLYYAVVVLDFGGEYLVQGGTSFEVDEVE